MSSESLSEVGKLFTAAHGGSTESLGRLLALYSNHFKLLVTAQIDRRLRSRVSPSDIVQETFYEANRDFHQFQGHSMGQFVAWLRRILTNNILRAVEQHLLAEKRDVRREVSLDQVRSRLEHSTVRLETMLAGNGESPSAGVHRYEREIILADALAELPVDYRDVIVLRHIEGLPFNEVAEQMERSPGAVRMLWLRAMQQLREKFEEGDLL